MKDLRSFTIPYIVGTSEFPKCLYDLGVSINLMPLTVFRKLGLGEVKTTNMSLQLADHSIKKTHGVMKDFEEDNKCLLIFRRPFLNTYKALIDVNEGKVTLRVGD